MDKLAMIEAQEGLPLLCVDPEIVKTAEKEHGSEVRVVGKQMQIPSCLRWNHQRTSMCPCACIRTVALLVLLLFLALKLQKFVVPLHPLVRYERWLSDHSVDDSTPMFVLPKEPKLSSGFQLTVPTDFYGSYADMWLAFLLHLPDGISRLGSAFTIRLGAQLLKLVFWESPSSSDNNLVGFRLSDYCQSCFLLATEEEMEKAARGHDFVIELDMPDAGSKWPASATLHLDQEWVIQSVDLHESLPGESGNLNPSDIVQNLLTQVLNLKLHTVAHQCAATLSHLAHKHIPPGNQIHTFLTDFLHPWASVAIDIQGYAVASLDVMYGTILQWFYPDLTSSFLEYSVLGLDHYPPTKKQWFPFGNILEMRQFAKRLAPSFIGARTFYEASILFEHTARHFVHVVYTDDSALRSDEAVIAYLRAVRTNLAPYVAVLDMPNLVPRLDGHISRETLISVLEWFMNIVLVHQVVMRDDSFVLPDTNPLPRWTLYETGLHRRMADGIMSSLAAIPNDLPVSAFVQDASWPHEDTRPIIREFQSSIKSVGLNLTYVCW